ncbi:hypothetical protein OHS18_06735 [Amycolatopsis sp. NBC_00355]|uniref:hypothetical protein n=1 Tax=Amycolatopsis sp. NBC_00355 TaxID=2975957 RepID=UPI002E271CCA
MSAVIHIDPDAIHPVIDGLWHRTWVRGIPVPGEPLSMMCGAEAVVTFAALSERRARGGPTPVPALRGRLPARTRHRAEPGRTAVLKARAVVCVALSRKV